MRLYTYPSSFLVQNDISYRCHIVGVDSTSVGRVNSVETDAAVPMVHVCQQDRWLVYVNANARAKSEVTVMGRLKRFIRGLSVLHACFRASP